MKLSNWVQIDLQYVRTYVCIRTYYLCMYVSVVLMLTIIYVDTEATDPTAETQQDGGPDEMKVLKGFLCIIHSAVWILTHTIQFNTVPGL